MHLLVLSCGSEKEEDRKRRDCVWGLSEKQSAPSGRVHLVRGTVCFFALWIQFHNSLLPAVWIRLKPSPSPYGLLTRPLWTWLSCGFTDFHFTLDERNIGGINRKGLILCFSVLKDDVDFILLKYQDSFSRGR